MLDAVALFVDAAKYGFVRVERFAQRFCVCDNAAPTGVRVERVLGFCGCFDRSRAAPDCPRLRKRRAGQDTKTQK
jgi:hypothetical protein